ncbi:MAG TPA: hypothetical protein VMA13_09460 [Candidatus Saccharimonadales bacterium]|nr:hypothetical protein [Candidatus Saccharimonadales bacterium]
MAENKNGDGPAPSVEEIQQGWHDLNLKVRQLDAELTTVEQENRDLRSLLERVVEHRQKSHTEMVNILTGLVTKLPINDVGVVVSRLVEHNAEVNETCAALARGKVEDNQLQPVILKVLEQTKSDLADVLKAAVEELIKLDAPFETDMLQSLLEKPEHFHSQAFVRANRGFVKGQIPRERIAKEFGEEALIFFKDLTTDPKLNPRPKPEEIMLAFQNDFETLLQQNPDVISAKRNELAALHKKVQASKADTAKARAQKDAFLRLCFACELLHYYDNQATESPDVVFAQRLPPLIEQLVIAGESNTLDEKLIQQAEQLLGLIIKTEHRHAVINNMGKAGGLVRTLRFVLTFRAQKPTELDPVTLDLLKHLISPGTIPKTETILPVLRLIPPDMQAVVVRAISSTDRLHREDAEALGKAIAKELGLKDVEDRLNARSVLSTEQERKIAWTNIEELISRHAPPAEIADVIRNRLKLKYDDAEIKQSWLTLTDSEPMSFIRIFCALPYLPDGQTDPNARVVLESYVQRLMHEKYAATHHKVLIALRNMFKVKANSPALVNFLALVKWVEPGAAVKLSQEIGMPVAA